MNQEIINKLKAIIDKDIPLISNLSNASAILNEMNDINWCGFYLVKDNKLILGPFQGEVACTTINFDKGVCGYCYRQKEIIIVPNVNEFPGHIACSTKSKSEIVAPIINNNNKVVALIDIDSPIYDRFQKEDKELLNQASEILAPLFYE